MHNLFDVLATAIFVIPWLMGLVIAQGFWQTLYALFPPYAWYIVVEHALKLQGWI